MALTLLLLALLTRAAADASTRNAFHSHPWRGDGEPLPSAAALLDLRAPAPPFTLAACAIVRNKGPYLREWVYYHWLLGFQHFWLYENESTDDTRAVLGTLVARGLVTLLDWPGPLGAQKRQLEHCFNASGPAGQTRWMGSFDADEFVAVLNHDPRQSPLLNSSLTFALHDHLQRFSDSGKRVGAISLDRMEFTADGHRTRPAGLVIATHTERELQLLGPSATHCGKVIVLTEALVRTNCAHEAILKPGWTTVRVDFSKFAGSCNDMGSILTEPIRINEYLVRDHGECLEKWHRKVLTAPTTWRVQAGRALCDQNIVGGQGYDARTKSRDAFLAHSEFVPLLTELLLLLREGA